MPAAVERPFGRGVNFQISVASIDPLEVALRAASWTLFMEPETKWYRTGKAEAGVVQFLVQDPDGYLIRFQASLGRSLSTLSHNRFPSDTTSARAAVGWVSLRGSFPEARGLV